MKRYSIIEVIDGEMNNGVNLSFAGFDEATDVYEKFEYSSLIQEHWNKNKNDVFCSKIFYSTILLSTESPNIQMSYLYDNEALEVVRR